MVTRRDKAETICQNKKLFLQHYLTYGSVGATLKACGIKNRGTFYKWCADDPAFKRIYDEQLVPDRRDQLSSIVYQAAMGIIKVQPTQLTAAFGYLKATDHLSQDGLIFTEKYQHEVSGNRGGPLELIVRWDGNRNQSSTPAAPPSTAG